MATIKHLRNKRGKKTRKVMRGGARIGAKGLVRQGAVRRRTNGSRKPPSTMGLPHILRTPTSSVPARQNTNLFMSADSATAFMGKKASMSGIGRAAGRKVAEQVAAQILASGVQPQQPQM